MRGLSIHILTGINAGTGRSCLYFLSGRAEIYRADPNDKWLRRSVEVGNIWQRTRITRNGALAGIIAGAATVIDWANLDGGLFDVCEIVPGFIMSALAIVLVSLRDPLPSVAARFFDD